MAVITAANLKFYLSGGAGNTDPLLSFGGIRSTTVVAGTINNLFDDITGDQNATGQTDYRCVFFRNEDVNATGLITPGTWIDTQASPDAIAIGLDPAGKNAAAATPVNRLTAPTGVTFTTPLTKAAFLALTAAPYATNDYIAIWIRRTVTAASAATLLDTASIRVEGDTVP